MSEVSPVLKYRIYTCKENMVKEIEGTMERPALTAITENKKRSEKVVLIGALRKLIQSAEPLSTQRTLETVETKRDMFWDRSKTISEGFGINTFGKRKVKHQTRGYSQSASVPKEKESRNEDTLKVRRPNIRSLTSIDMTTRKDYTALENMIESRREYTLADSLRKRRQKKGVAQEQPSRPQTQSYSQQLRLLKGKKLEQRLEASADNLTSFPSGETLEVEGSKVNEESQMAQIGSAASVNPPLVSTSSKSDCYKNILLYTKRRLGKSVPGPKNITQTKPKRPDIVIPCHTNVECTFCQLYDTEHETHIYETEQITPRETSTEETKEADSSKKDQPKISSAFNIKASKVTKPADHSAKEMQKKLMLTFPSAAKQFERSSSKSKPSKSMTLNEETTLNGKYLKDNNSLAKKDVTDSFQSPSNNGLNDKTKIVPKVYRFRYTKSSNLSKRTSYVTTGVIHS